MIKQPLFGQDSSPHITSMFISAIATLVCWIIFCILCVVIKFKPQLPEYKEIQIVLESTPVEEKLESAAVAELVEAPALEESVAEVKAPALPNPVENPVAEAKVEAKKENPAPAKTQTATAKTQQKNITTTKKETPADKKVSDQIYKSVEELMEEQMSSKKPSNVPDWWNEDTTVTEQQTEASKTPGKVTTKSGMSGSAGKTGEADTKTSISSTKSNPASEESPREDVQKALKDIAKAEGKTGSGGNSSGTNNPSPPKTQNFDFSWEGSGKRTSQGSLSIDLGSNTIESTRTVTITIKVLESGYVDRGSIEIDIASKLTKEIRESIYESISKWRFNSSNEISFATFKYTIEKQ